MTYSRCLLDNRNLNWPCKKYRSPYLRYNNHIQVAAPRSRGYIDLKEVCSLVHLAFFSCHYGTYPSGPYEIWLHKSMIRLGQGFMSYSSLILDLNLDHIHRVIRTYASLVELLSSTVETNDWGKWVGFVFESTNDVTKASCVTHNPTSASIITATCESTYVLNFSCCCDLFIVLEICHFAPLSL